MPLTLLITEGPSKGTSFTFSEHSTFLVGRALDAHFRLPEDDRYFSRRHFIIEINPPLCKLVDLKSRNGTLVNGKQVEMIDLKDGDRIQGGQTTMLVKLEAEPGVTLDCDPQTNYNLPTPEGTAIQVGPPRETVSSSSTVVEIPGYEIQSEIGRGGMGVVYRAVRKSDGTTVAIKTILPEAQPTGHAVARFLREAETIRSLKHAGIVAGLDHGESKGMLWLAMEFIDGKDGNQVLEAEGPLAIPRAVDWMRQLLEALGHAHDRGFIHRDVKPANLLVARTAIGEQIKLTDFGLARAYQVSRLSGLTLAGASGGTPKFMPPEQVLDMRSVKPSGDQYSAAATLYHLLTRKYLFENAATVVEWFLQILEGTPTPIQKHRPEIPDSLAKVIHRALSRKPEDRYPDVRMFSQALQEAIR